MAKFDNKQLVPPKAGLVTDPPGESEAPAPATHATSPQTHGFKPKLVVIPPAVKAPSTPIPPKLHLEHKSPVATQQASTEKPRLLVLPTNLPLKRDAPAAPAVPLPATESPPPAARKARPATPPLRLIPPAELQQAHPSPATPGTPPAGRTPRIALQSDTRKQRTPKTRSGRLWLLALPAAVVVAAALGWWMLVRERTTTSTVPPPLTTQPAAQALFPAPPPFAVEPERPAPSGSLQLNAFTIAADGARHTVTNQATFILRQARTPLTLTTNAPLPFVWQNLTADNYLLSVTVPGYRPLVNTDVTVAVQQDADVALDLLPLPTHVRFIPSAPDVTFAVWRGERYLGSSKETFTLDPFMTHVLTFKASGWRESTVKITLDFPGTTYRCRVAMARIATGMAISLVSDTGDIPGTGLLSVNDSDPVLVALPLKRTALSYAGEIKISLTIAGYRVVNNTQQVRLTDGQITPVVFRVEPNE